MRHRQRFDKDINMKKDLLICIAHHFSMERFKYLDKLLENFTKNYKCSFDIIIDMNAKDLHFKDYKYNGIDIQTSIHYNLEHPFHLTWKHRQHIKDNIDNYHNFLYTEDDMFLPFENYLNYLENFKLLWPHFVPSFIRVEEIGSEQFVADIHERQPLEKVRIENISASIIRNFSVLKPLINYHAFWVMPQKELKETMKDDFVKLSDGREFASSYTAWTLGKPTLVEIENNKVSEKCFSYHLPNNAPNVTLKVEDIFI